MSLCEAPGLLAVLLVKCNLPSAGSSLFTSVHLHCGAGADASFTQYSSTEFAVHPQVKFDTGLRLTLMCVCTMSSN